VTFAYRANTDLVMGLWLSSLPGLNPGMTGAQLPEKPEENASLCTSGFVSWRTVGGNPDMYIPERKPVLQVSCYGFPPTGGSSSRKPQWNVANGLAEDILAACQQPDSFNAKLTLPTGYPPARVQQAHALTEPMRIYGDRAYWAIYRFDLQVYWLELPS